MKKRPTRRHRRRVGIYSLSLWKIKFKSFFSTWLGLVLPGLIGGVAVYHLTTPDPIKGIFHKMEIQSDLMGQDSTTTIVLDIFSKNDVAETSQIYIETDTPIASLTSIDKLGDAKYYKIRNGGLGKTILKIDLGAMQNMTRRTLKLRFDKAEVKINRLEVWNEKYISKPLRESVRFPRLRPFLRLNTGDEVHSRLVA